MAAHRLSISCVAIVRERPWRLVAFGLLLGLLPAPLALAEGPAEPAPIVYTLRVPAPETHVVEVEAIVSAEGRTPSS